MTATANLRIMRRVDTKMLSQATLEYLAMREAFDPSEGDLLSNDAVREAEYNEEIIEATVGFAMVNEDGEVIREDDNLKRIEALRRSARIVFSEEIFTDEDDDDE